MYSVNDVGLSMTASSQNRYSIYEFVTKTHTLQGDKFPFRLYMAVSSRT